jgi:chromatin remodeling complex protein RSC6
MARGSALMKKLELSDELADFMRANTASRGEVMKKIWAYIKKHDLNEGRIIHPDDELAPILGTKSLDMFKMTKVLSGHFVKS